MTLTPELYIAFAALCISLGALWYTIRAFLRKSGTDLRGAFEVTSSVYCDDKYVSSVTLYNLKDRAVPIFGIYLSLGPGYYIELDNFEEDPLILKPFEAWHREYDPIEMYTISTSRIDIDPLLKDRKTRQRLVISTGDGKYVVRNWMRRWNPMYEWVSNYTTAVIHPRRSDFRGRSYGGNATYIVEFQFANAESEVVPIYASDHTIKKFKKFRLTPESLATKEALEEYLLEQAVNGNLNCRDIVVHDLQTWRNQVYDERQRPTIRAEPQTWLVHHVLGRIVTWYDRMRSRRQNRKLQAQRLAASKDAPDN